MKMKKKIIFIILFISFMLFLLDCHIINKIDIGYLTFSKDLSYEHQEAIKFLRDHQKWNVKLLTTENSLEKFRNLDLIWVHLPDSNQFIQFLGKKNELNFIKDYYNKGGNVLFTDYAAYLPHQLKIESRKPEIRILDIEDNWFFDQKGLQSYKGHPVFQDMFGGTFIWDASENHQLPCIGYFNENFPEEGKVIAVEKSYLTIHSNNKLMLEFENESGKITAIGAFIYFSRDNRLQTHLHKLIENCIHYMVGGSESSLITYWQEFDHKPKKFNMQTRPRLKQHSRNLVLPPISDLVLTQETPQNNSFDLAGRRASIMGKENGGIDEFWVHPFRIFMDYQAGIVYKDSVLWLNNQPVKIEVRPESFLRIYQTPLGDLKEIIYPALNQPGGLIHYCTPINESVRLIVKFRSDMRWMWPYDENAIGDIWYAIDTKLQAIHLKNSSPDHYAVIGTDIKPTKYLIGPYDDILIVHEKFYGKPSEQNQIYCAYLYELNEHNDGMMNIAIVGTNTGREDAISCYHKLLGDPQNVYDATYQHYQDLLNRVVTLETPDEEFNRLWKWTIVGTDKFFTYTPGVGSALLAGYSTTDRGWIGEHKISGRAGYAWYFGRDSEWSGFAIDDYGDFGLVRQQLEFLQKYQDLSGKVFHEISTSGVVHFDAANETLLYIILAAHYLRASGDLPYILKNWPYIEKALTFLYSTDTDGDKLIENTNVGHGRVESGKLWGAHTTFYLAALWAKTLKDAAYITKHLGKKNLYEKYRSDAVEVQRILTTEFWNDSTGFFNYGKVEDDKYSTEKTVLPTVAMYFNLLDDSKVNTMLNEYASNYFSTDWGVRIVSSASPLYELYGYQYGSVWPLFTGWTALGDYTYGKSVQGFTHIMENLLIKNYWALGYVEEVMNDEEYKPSGVCYHQCWSETSILHPGIHGMIGWKPDALANTATLSPKFPINWDAFTIRNLRMGKSVLQLYMNRSKRRTNFRFKLVKGRSVKLSFAPKMPMGLKIRSARLDGEELNIQSHLARGVLQDTVKFHVIDNHELIFEHEKGIGVIPFIPRPKPGEGSSGYKVIRDSLINNEYSILFEGRSNTQNNFQVRLFDQMIDKIEGAELLSLQKNGVLNLKVEFPKNAGQFSQKLVTIKLQ